MEQHAAAIVRDLPLGNGVKVLATHPEGLVALEKPCGILSHPNLDEDRGRSLLDASWSADRERFIWKTAEESHRFYLLHRLDSATSGVILGCVNPNLARELKTQFAKRKVSKSYLAVVAGIAQDTELFWKDNLRKRTVGSRLRVDANARGGGLAETKVQLLEVKRTNPRLSLLRMNPLTGRTHQLRVQAAKRNLPIVGDSTYGNFPFNREVLKAVGKQRLFLHASSIRIRWEWKGREYSFEAESRLPEVFRQLLQLKY